MTFLVDMNLSPQWAGFLRSAGHEAHHWSAIGPPNALDEAIMAYARERDWIVFTHDLDFGTLLACSGDRGPSVVQIREQNVDPEAVGGAVLAALAQCRESLEAGALVTIDLRRAKATLLPVRRGPR